MAHLSNELDTPVVFICFNRPDTTQRVFQTIRDQKPKKLLIIADGPRKNRDGEAEKCVQVRQIVSQVDWPCEVLTNFSDENMGCRKRLSTGITWAFQQVDRAIILEDDCLPDPTFFRFCEELLEKYKSNENIFSICGTRLAENKQFSKNSYEFSKYMHVWGWAGWRRSWKFYDVNMKQWPELRKSGWLEKLLSLKRSQLYWDEAFECTYNGKLNTWDYQWLFCHWLNNGITILPNKNLISNIGFGGDATHTSKKNKYSELPVSKMESPLLHPEKVELNKKLDEWLTAHVYAFRYRAMIKRFFLKKIRKK